MATPPDDLLDHDYDGIKEFDNPLPKWWVYLFYGCIVFAIVYVPYYHFGPGDLPREQWAADMSQWYEDHPPPELASHAELEAMAADPTFVTLGQSVYNVRCVACHSADGGGLVGPNLTDDFTIYGQDRDKIVSVVFHGTPNGMLAWKDQLSLTEIYQVGAYVHSLRGKTPVKPKEAQGVAIVDAPVAEPVEVAAPTQAAPAEPEPEPTPEPEPEQAAVEPSGAASKPG